ncbi:hypothetical protein Bca52824_007215 [Brassica carinata]|uniref:Aldehyde dehydrogenase domain-containing protein n=1 Tax=Brassica carinata TaxID=52824 RepID=A0A8X8B7N9_BRACI|nr:hypothetical protein Bca52824_007215 [Brassica carinata]
MIHLHMIFRQGVRNVAVGNAPEIGDALLTSSQVRKITFKGSKELGKKVDVRCCTYCQQDQISMLYNKGVKQTGVGREGSNPSMVAS